MAMQVPMPVCVEILFPAKDQKSWNVNGSCQIYTHSYHTNLCRLIPKTMIENPITNTRFNTFPTACERGATRSKVLVATCCSSCVRLWKNHHLEWRDEQYQDTYERINRWMAMCNPTNTNYSPVNATKSYPFHISERQWKYYIVFDMTLLKHIHFLSCFFFFSFLALRASQVNKVENKGQITKHGVDNPPLDSRG